MGNVRQHTRAQGAFSWRESKRGFDRFTLGDWERYLLKHPASTRARNVLGAERVAELLAQES